MYKMAQKPEKQRFFCPFGSQSAKCTTSGWVATQARRSRKTLTDTVFKKYLLGALSPAWGIGSRFSAKTRTPNLAKTSMTLLGQESR